MEKREQLELDLANLRTKYRPKQEYSILIFVSERLDYYAGVFMKVIIKEKKEESIAECAKHQYVAKDIKQLEELLQPYLVRI